MSGKERKTSVRSNLKRCPLMKIVKKEFVKDGEGNIVGEVMEESFSDCYRSFCMAWNSENNTCMYFSAEEDED